MCFSIIGQHWFKPLFFYVFFFVGVCPLNIFRVFRSDNSPRWNPNHLGKFLWKLLNIKNSMFWFMRVSLVYWVLPMKWISSLLGFKKNHKSLISKLLIAILITMFIFNNLSTQMFTWHKDQIFGFVPGSQCKNQWI